MLDKISNKNHKWSLVLTIFVLILLCLWAWYNRDIFENINQKTIVWFVLSSLCYLAMNFVLGITNQLLLRSYKIKLSAKEIFSLPFIGHLWDYFLPIKGGVAFGAIYLKKKFGLSYIKFGFLIIIRYIIFFFIIGIFGLLILLYLPRNSLFTTLLLGLLLLIFCGVLLICLLRIKYSPKNKLFLWLKEQKIFDNIKKSIQLYRQQPMSLHIYIAFWLMLSLALNGLRYYCGIKALDIDLNYIGALFIAILGQISMLIKVIPGNLGITESAVGIAAIATGIPFADGVAVSLFSRAASFITIILLGPMINYKIIRDIESPRKM